MIFDVSKVVPSDSRNRCPDELRRFVTNQLVWHAMGCEDFHQFRAVVWLVVLDMCFILIHRKK